MPRRAARPILALCGALLAAGPAPAADPSEWLAIPSGGLSIRQVPGLTLGEMVVTLSPREVKATYLLANAAEQRRLLDVGFPIPSPQHLSSEGPPLSSAFSDAKVTLDGETMPLAEVRIRVFMRGLDVTDLLIGAGIDLAALAGGNMVELPRELRRAMEKAMIDNGIPLDPFGWSLAVEPAWQVPLAARSTGTLTLTYSPYAGRSLDRLPGDEMLDNLAHLAAYCAEDDTGLLAWVRQQIAARAAARQAELVAAGQDEEQAESNAFADIELLDLSFLWSGGRWPKDYAEVTLIVDPGEGRAAFCAPGGEAAPEVRYGDDGRYRVELTDLPAGTRLDVMFLQ